MSTFEDNLKEVFLAGVGALAITGEKAKEMVDTLIEKGGITLEQGKEINKELQQKATETISNVRSDALAKLVESMNPEERAAFAAEVSKMVEEANGAPESEDGAEE